MKKFTKKSNLGFLLIFILVALFINYFPKTAHNFSSNKQTEISQNTSKVTNDFQGVADYIHKYNRLPDNYITKEQAYKLGWKPGEDLWKYASGKSIGGDTFTNQEKCLPDAPKRVWHECDINYNGGHRGSDRLLYSNDGLIYGTKDHYQTFVCYYNGTK